MRLKESTFVRKKCSYFSVQKTENPRGIPPSTACLRFFLTRSRPCHVIQHTCMYGVYQESEKLSSHKTHARFRPLTRALLRIMVVKRKVLRTAVHSALRLSSNLLLHTVLGSFPRGSSVFMTTPATTRSTPTPAHHRFAHTHRGFHHRHCTRYKGLVRPMGSRRA